MSNKPRLGLLPLYVALYDDKMPLLRSELEPLALRVRDALVAEGAEVEIAKTCRLESEVRAEVDRLKTLGVDMLVTLHLAYSPSLESATVLAESGLPVLMFDTTPDADFGRDVDPARLTYNHGIHGVQDLASVLRRMNCQPWIVAGHLENPATAKRAAAIARAALAHRRFSQTRALRVGPPFAGMGDFQVAETTLQKRLGITVEQIGVMELGADIAAVMQSDIEAEMKSDAARFENDCPPDVHERSLRVGLGLRRRLEQGNYSAFSLNFMAFDQSDGLVNVVPFLECCKAMARGIGYAGEGDVLTASLVGALGSAFGATTFTEIFCPDWRGGSLFLSHMGEINPQVCAPKPRLYEKQFPFTPALNPASVAASICPGQATLVNLAPGPNDSFALIAAPLEVLEDGTHPNLHGCVRSWVRPAIPLEPFLERYSELGGTHHSALMLGDHREALSAFARMCRMEFHVI